MDAFMGTVLAVGFNYPPRGWLFCNGQTVPIQQNAAMFALLGTMYGGDGQNTFGIPDLRGRVVVGSQAQGPGLANVAQGEKAGSNNATVISNGTATITLNPPNLPQHNHSVSINGNSFTATSTLNASTDTTGGQLAATGATLSSTQGLGGAGQAAIYETTTPTAGSMKALSPASVTTLLSGIATVTSGNTGSGTPLTVPVVSSATISNMQPYLGLNYIIAMEGIFPSRN